MLGGQGTSTVNSWRWRGLALAGATLVSLLSASALAHPPSTKSRAALREHLTRAPHDVAARVKHSTLLRESGRARAALRELDRALEVQPGSAALHVGRAELLLTLGRYDEARVALGRVEAAEQGARFQLAAARWAVATGDALAAAHYEASLALAPDVSVALEYGGWLERGQRLKDAVRLYETQLVLGDGATVLRLALIRVLRASARASDTLDHVNRLIAQAQQPASYLLLRAEVYEELGRGVDAERDRTRALSLARRAYESRPSAQRLALRGRARLALADSGGMRDLQVAAGRAPGSPLIARWFEEARAARRGER